MFATRLSAALALAALLAGSLTDRALAQDAASVEDRFQEWKLSAVTGVPTAAALAELEELAAEAGEGQPKLLAAMEVEAEALRARVAPAAVDPAQKATDESAAVQADVEKEVLRRALERAIAEGNGTFIQELGQRAVPALTEMVRAWDGTPSPEDARSVLSWLAFVSVEDALNVSLELMESKSFLLKRSTIAALSYGDSFRDDDVWEAEGEADWRLVDPRWAQILVSALKEPALEPDALRPIIVAFVERGQLAPSLGDLARRAGVTPDSIDGVMPAKGRWFAESFLDSKSSSLRARAVKELAGGGHAEAIASMASDPHSDVRQRVARSLFATGRVRYSDETRTGLLSETYSAPGTPAVADAVISIGTSGDSKAVRWLKQHLYRHANSKKAPALPADQLVRVMAGVRDHDVRRALFASVRYLPEGERFNTFATIIRNQPETNEPGDERDSVSIDPEQLGLSREDYFWPLVDLADAEGYFTNGHSHVVDMLNEWASTNDVDASGLIARAVKWDETHLLKPYSERSIRNAWATTLGMDERARLLEAFAPAGKPLSEKALDGLRGAAQRGYFGDEGLLRKIIGSSGIKLEVRAVAAKELVSEAPEKVQPSKVPELAAVLAHPSCRREAQGALDGLNKNVLVREALLRAIVESPNSDPAHLALLDVEVAEDATIDAVLRRLPMDGEYTVSSSSGGLRINVMTTLLNRSTEALDPRLELLDLRHFDIAWRFFGAAAGSGDSLLFPLVAKTLLEMGSENSSFNFGVAAVASYMNDEAARVLLEAAKGVASQEKRQVVMDSLRQITEWREAAAAWEKSAGAQAKRATAIEDLVAMIEDGSQSVETRAASIRGLGLLGAAEELPRIIRALSSTEKAIQEAARAALERLESEE